MTSPGSVAFTILGIEIMWYGVLIATGMVLGVSIAYYRAPKFGIKPDNILDIAIFSLPIGIIGARLYYVFFNWTYYSDDILEIINIRNGGLAIHGGLIAGLITAVIVCRHCKISSLNAFDLLVPSVALAQAIGRWGNFFNSEAHGGPTDLPWGIFVDGQKVHPTFLYESIWCLILFFLLSYVLKNRRTFNGQVLCLYGILYSIERIMVEQLRTDSLMIGPFKQAQLFSLFVIVLSAALYVYFKKKQPLGNQAKNQAKNQDTNLQ